MDQDIKHIALKVLESMGGDPLQICNGYCTDYAKLLVDLVGYGTIIDNLSEEMRDELAGYETAQPEELRTKISHCWVKIDNRFYDAFNPEGVEYETDLDFVEVIERNYDRF